MKGFKQSLMQAHLGTPTQQVEELEGWLYVTNRLLLDSTRSTVLEVEEPSHRAALEMEYVRGLSSIFHDHVAVLAPFLNRLATSNCLSRAKNVVEVEGTVSRVARQTLLGAEVVQQKKLLQQLVEEKDALELDILMLQRELQLMGEAPCVTPEKISLHRGNVTEEHQEFDIVLHELDDLRKEMVMQREQDPRQEKNVKSQLLCVQGSCRWQKQLLQKTREQLKIFADVLMQYQGQKYLELSMQEEPAESLRHLLKMFVDYAETMQRERKELRNTVIVLRERLLSLQPTEPTNERGVPYPDVVPPLQTSPVALTLPSVCDELRKILPVKGGVPCGNAHTSQFLRSQDYSYKENDDDDHRCHPCQEEHTHQRSPMSLCSGNLHSMPKVSKSDDIHTSVKVWRERMLLLRTELCNLRREIDN